MLSDDFEKLVSQALDDLPKKYRDQLDNVDIVIQDEPNWLQRAKLNLPPWATLFGLYEGIPKIARGAGYMFVAPDKITIFQGPIQRRYRTPNQIKQKVTQTVLHEIGHHFGLSEHQLRNRSKTR